MTAILVLLALLLLPGIGASLALYGPGRLPLVTRLALALGLGYAITGGVAYALMVLSVLNPGAYFTLVVLATIAVWVFALRRASLREHWTAIAAEVRSDRWPFVIGLAVLVAFAILRLGFLGDFPTSSPFRYWVDGIELADHGGIPPATLHYGALWPPVTSKVFLNAFTAGAHYATAGAVPQAIAAMLWITAVGTAVGLWALGRELGLRLTAPLLPILLIANRRILGDEMTTDLVAYRAEIVGRMVLFVALVMAIRAIRDRTSFRDPLVAALVFGAGSGTHLVAFVAMTLFLGWYTLMRLMVDRDLRGIVRHGAVLAGATAVLAGAVLLLPRGEIGFEGATEPGSYERTDVRFDKSRFLWNGSLAPASHPPRGAFYVPPGGVVHTFIDEATNAPPDSPIYGRESSIALGLGALVLVVVMYRRLPADLRIIGPTALGFGASLVLAALFFSFAYDVYIPATFGVRRLSDYASFPLVLIGATLLEAGLGALRRTHPWRPVAAAAVVVALVGALVMPSARATPFQLATGERARQALEWVRQNLPCDARLLTNQRSLGAFRVMTGRVAVLEGMGPFLRPRMLDVIVDSLLGARGFYQNPTRSAAYLEEQGIDYVLFLKRFQVGQAATLGRIHPDALHDVPFLEPVHRSRILDVYRVVGLEPRGKVPDPRDHPAYDCRRGPID